MSPAVTVAGYVVLLFAMVIYQLVSVLLGRSATLGQVLGALKKSLAGRLLLAVGWMWVGWHLFVRASWR